MTRSVLADGSAQSVADGAALVYALRRGLVPDFDGAARPGSHDEVRVERVVHREARHLRRVEHRAPRRAVCAARRVARCIAAVGATTMMQQIRTALPYAAAASLAMGAKAIQCGNDVGPGG